jgi:hypothetical protein
LYSERNEPDKTIFNDFYFSIHEVNELCEGGGNENENFVFIAVMPGKLSCIKTMHHQP